MPSARHSHSLTEFQGRLYLFGGIGEKEYAAAEVFVLETEQSEVVRLRDVFSKHIAASMGVVSSGMEAGGTEVSDWLETNESADQTPTPRLLKKMSRTEFCLLQRELFQKSLQQLVNQAFFQH